MYGDKISELYQSGRGKVLSAELTPQRAKKLLESGLSEKEAKSAYFSLVNHGKNENDFISLLTLAGHLQRAIDRPIMVHLRSGDLSPQRLPDFFERVEKERLVNFLIIGGDKRVDQDGFSTTEDLLWALKNGAPRLSLGATIDLNRPNAFLKAVRRQAAGADFLISQVIFDEKPLLAFREKIGHENPSKEIPVIPGLLAKPTLGQLRWVNEVLKVTIPDAFFAQPEKAGQLLRERLSQAHFVGEHLFIIPEK